MAQSFRRKRTRLGSGGVRTGSTWTKSSTHAGTQGSEDEIWLSAYFCTFGNTATLIAYGLWLPLCFPGGSDGKASAYDAGDPGSIPGSGRSPGEGNGIPLQYSCLGNPMDRGAWQATVHRVTISQIGLSNQTTATYLLSYFNWLQQSYTTITI